MKGWKTIIFNIIMGVLLVLDQQGASWGLSVELVSVITVIGNFILRFLTTTPALSSTVGGRPGDRGKK